ncbi:zinc-binding dehydrogenase [Tepidiforma sp.]|uniref:zinc-binding dehydrogenase n=1 Tax=Tepidiforma sp. TaxID=2682230 RepID=UPI002ADDB6A8|nr:zinc-binding dehydrogenase [Tepidiforma sp.]
MRAMVLRGKTLAIETLATPEPGPGQVLARVLACGICGSDLHAAKYLDDMIAAARRSGSTQWDEAVATSGIVMGHEFVAEIVRPGPGAEAWQPGTRVTSIPVLLDPTAPNGLAAIGYSATYPGAYGEYVLMSAPLLLPVPEGLPDEVAATTEPCAVGLHAVREANMQPGQAALVMGAGPIGLMTLLWLRHEGVAPIAVTELSPERRELARQLGADLVIDPRTTPVLEAWQQAVRTPAPPVVFECIGVEGTLQQAMELVDRMGRVIVVGVCMQEDRILPLVAINKQLTLKFVLGYTPAEYAEALEALGKGTIDTSPMISRIIGLDDLPTAFTALADPKDCKIIVAPSR